MRCFGAPDFPHLHRRSVLLVAVVGLVGGAVGAAYVSVLHVLERFLAPEHHDAPVAQVLVLVAVGAAIGILPMPSRPTPPPYDVCL